MANSLRAKLSKLRHDRKITEEEYQELIGKLDGHDAKVRADYAKEIDMDRISCLMGRTDGYMQGKADKYQEITSEYMLLTEKQVEEIRTDTIDECIEALGNNIWDIAKLEQLKEKKE